MDGGTGGLLLLVAAALAFIYVKDAFREGGSSGLRAIVICCSLLALSLIFPIFGRILLVAIFLSFMVIGFMKR